VSAIQVKNVPPELHDELRRRAADEGKTVSEVILESLRRDLRRRSMREWLDQVGEHRPDRQLTRDQIGEIMRDSRREMFGENGLDDRP
jgi:plasmid stability protein